ncbi:DUF7373 family lipoprotein [Nocardia vermiculata]|uniref:Lipoprotein n=1 Tax=Nocardia vermiculata TaxID=257274 RepID=A0A846XTL2_9NOCA|nr:hypothetical protein [Nocardia vermiculata]NKY50433.1 hypothetical protein [Nocardia vermiculata]
MRTRLFRTGSAAACLTALFALTGCASTLGGWAGPAEVDVRTLDVGPYEVRPLDIHVDQRPGFTYAPYAAGMRMADYVITPDQVDPHLTKYAKSGSFTPGSPPDALGGATAMGETLKRNHTVYGFTTAGSTADAGWKNSGWPEPSTTSKSDATTLAITVLAYNDADSATRAAGDIYTTDFDTFKDKNKAVELTKHTSAQAHWQPGGHALRSFLAHGSYVVSILAITPGTDLDALTTLTEQAFDKELPVLDGLETVTDEQTVQLPWDPDYLLSRALNTMQTGRPQYEDDNGIFGARGFLHYLPDRKIGAKNVADLQGEGFAKTSDALVVRTADAAAAKRAVTGRILLRGAAGAPADSVPKVPDSACVENTAKDPIYYHEAPKRYVCLVSYRNYVGYVTSNQLVDVHQRAAAQYALFANSQWLP